MAVSFQWSFIVTEWGSGLVTEYVGQWLIGWICECVRG